VPALSEDLTKAVHTRCLQHYDSKKSEANKADSNTNAPCGEGQGDTPPTGSSTTPSSGEPAKLSTPSDEDVAPIFTWLGNRFPSTITTSLCKQKVP